MTRFVRGGSETARLRPYEGEDMARGRILTESERQSVYTMHCLGEKTADIASAYGIHASTVSRIIKELRESKGEDMAGGQQIVAGDKKNGRLLSCSDRNRFEGTCIVGGKSKRRTFTAVNARNAQQQWEKWCQTLRDEQEFLDMVERKGEPSEEPVKDEVDITPAPVPEIHVRPWKEVAEEREKRIAELEAHVAQLEDKERMLSVRDQVISDSEGEVPKLAHWFNSNGAFRVFWLDKPVYVLWARSDSPKLYGVYCSMESALAEVDRLNDVAKFLGQESVFEVEEVAWRG